MAPSWKNGGRPPRRPLATHGRCNVLRDVIIPKKMEALSNVSGQSGASHGSADQSDGVRPGGGQWRAFGRPPQTQQFDHHGEASPPSPPKAAPPPAAPQPYPQRPPPPKRA